MKTLIKHLIENNLDSIVEKSFLNCHVKGLHSIMLLESPEQTIRLFVSEPSTPIAKNTKFNILERGVQTVAFHPHHCDITLHVVKGTVTNHIVEQVSIEDEIYNTRNPEKLKGLGYFFAKKYFFESAIRSEERTSKFKYSSTQMLRFIDSKDISEGSSLLLKATDIHTVTTYDIGTTAWFVYEGKEDPNYSPFCFNVCELSEETNPNLYKKPTVHQIRYLLEIAGLL